MICGVCGGLGTYLGIDATVVRVLYAVISLVAGAGFLGLVLYFIPVSYTHLDVYKRQEHAV